MRNGFAGTAHNGIIYDTLGRQGIDDAGAGTDVPPAGAANGDFRTPANAAAGLIQVHDVTCNNVTTIPGPGTAEDNEVNVFGSGNIGCNGVNDANFGLVAETTSFTPTGVTGKLDSSLATIDLRPANTTATMTGSAPPASLDDDGDLRRCLRAVPDGALASTAGRPWVRRGCFRSRARLSTLAAGAVLLMLLKRRR